MSFRRQIKRAWAFGALACLAGLAAGFMAVALEMAGSLVLADLLAGATMLLIVGGALVALAGGVARPAQHWAFRHGLPAGGLRGFALRRPVLRWWLWVDEDGRNRDVG